VDRIGEQPVFNSQLTRVAQAKTHHLPLVQASGHTSSPLCHQRSLAFIAGLLLANPSYFADTPSEEETRSPDCWSEKIPHKYHGWGKDIIIHYHITCRQVRLQLMSTSTMQPCLPSTSPISGVLTLPFQSGSWVNFTHIVIEQRKGSGTFTSPLSCLPTNRVRMPKRFNLDSPSEPERDILSLQRSSRGDFPHTQWIGCIYRHDTSLRWTPYLPWYRSKRKYESRSPTN